MWIIACLPVRNDKILFVYNRRLAAVIGAFRSRPRKRPKKHLGGGAVFKAYQFILPGGTGGNILVTTVVTKQTYIIKGNINFQNCLEVGLNWSSPQPHPLLDKVMGSRFKTSVSVTLNTVAANWTSRGPAEGDIAEALSLNNPREYEQSIVPGSYGNKM